MAGTSPSILDALARSGGSLSGPLGSFSTRIEGRPPCSEACPAGIDVKAYVALIADRRYSEAVDVIRKANPFPGVCGRVCTHPCEAECTQAEKGESVAIRALKRFAAEYELSRKPIACSSFKPMRREKIAVAGAGPAGLTAAADLADAGFEVTVFEAAPKAGGLLTWGIPGFRLPKNLVQSEIRGIAAMGVTIKTDERIESPSSLLQKGFSAVILATGCQTPTLMNIEGEKSIGVIDCLDFLFEVNDGKRTSAKGDVVVIGGGNAALDAARTAARLGAKVAIAYRRTEEEMPADRIEVELAKREGIKLILLALPFRIVVENGQVGSVEFQRATLGDPDATGRRRPVPVPDDFFTLRADLVIRAVGSKPDISSLKETDLKTAQMGALEVDENNMTSARGVFAAGDLVTGPTSIVEAIRSGHDVARGVVAFLTGERKPKEADERVIVIEDATCREGRLATTRSWSSYDIEESGLDETSAISEASRCARCGLCSDCAVCLSQCEHRHCVMTDEYGKSQVVKLPATLAKAITESPESRDGWMIAAGPEKTRVSIEPVLANVDGKLCTSCALCEEACAYKAMRVKFEKGKAQTAIVDHSACRGCGACTSVCPSGAISQGWMADERLYGQAGEAAKGGVVAFSCIWHDSSSAMESRKGIVPVICTRRVSPGLVIESLVAGAAGVALVGCGSEGCHYLQGPWMGGEVAARMKTVLVSLGLDPARVTYIESEGNDDDAIAKFKKKLSKGKLEPFENVASKLPAMASGLGRGIAAAHALMAQPDMRKDLGSATGKYLVAPGCIPIVDSLMTAQGLKGPGRMLESAIKVLDAAGLTARKAEGIFGPGLRLRKWGMGGLYEQYAKRSMDSVRKAKPKALVALTEEAYGRFRDDWPKEFGALGFEVVALPALLKSKLKKSHFKEAEPLTVAFHSCGDGKFADDALSLVKAVPGIRAVRLKGGCGETIWAKPSAETKLKGIAILREAEGRGASVLVVDSHQCLAHLQASLAGWAESGVQVTDAYSLIASRMKGAK
ncbi:MAG: FAD-dependent oxidoreductase [Euryarchaeota archaeon]|nr:FAD-dependent oxidoreductase [Euryarchaeota archaeon]